MRFGLLGGKLSHSYSPQIHALLGDYEYPLFEKAPDEVGAFLKSGDFDGLNVTIPYKQTVIPSMSALSEAAEKIGAVNTITRLPSGGLYGDNTDYFGFSFLLDSIGFDVKDKKVLILGSGGASKTAVCVCRDRGAKDVVVISRRGENNYTNIEKNSDADFVFNATPVGMFPNNGVSPLDLGAFKNCLGVADMIYNPAKTALLLQAEEMNIPFANGLTMLCAQAVKSAESFLQTTFDNYKITSVINEMRFSMQNIVLVGMPGCGKSTAGRLLAEKLGRDFVDTDSIIEENEGRSIPRIFSQNGEEYFRECECKAVSAAGKQSGAVIATGGGAVLKKSNIIALRQNAAVVFLNADSADLETAGRPLSSSGNLAEMYRERLPFYQAASDFSVSVSRNVEITVQNILEGLRVK